MTTLTPPPPTTTSATRPTGGSPGSTWSGRLRRRMTVQGVVLGAANAAGGYAVTERMLEMFERKPKGGNGKGRPSVG